MADLGCRRPSGERLSPSDLDLLDSNTAARWRCRDSNCSRGKILSRLATMILALLPVFTSALVDTLLNLDDVETMSFGWHPYRTEYATTGKTSTLWHQ